MAAKFNEKTFNPEAFGKYVDRIPNLKRLELIKSREIVVYQDLFFDDILIKKNLES